MDKNALFTSMRLPYPLLTSWYYDQLTIEWNNWRAFLQQELPTLPLSVLRGRAAVTVMNTLAAEYAILEPEVQRRRSLAENKNDLLVKFWDALQELVPYRKKFEQLAGPLAIAEAKLYFSKHDIPRKKKYCYEIYLCTTQVLSQTVRLQLDEELDKNTLAKMARGQFDDDGWEEGDIDPNIEVIGVRLLPEEM